MQTVLEMLTSKLEAVDAQLTTLASNPRPPAASSASGQEESGRGRAPKQGSGGEIEGASEVEQNLAFLKSLNVEQVSKLP